MNTSEKFKNIKIFEIISRLHPNSSPKTSKPLVILNSDYFSADTMSLPKEICEFLGLPKENMQKYLISPQECSQFPLKKEHRATFLIGKPILIDAADDCPGNKKKSGGQHYDAIEQWITMALFATTWLVVEKIRILREKQGKRRHLSVASARDEIIWDLIHYWRKTDSTAPDENACIKKFSTLVTKGQNSNWELWFPHCCLKKYLSEWLTKFDNATTIEIEQEVRFQKEQIISLIKCQKRATLFRRARKETRQLEINGLEEKPVLKPLLPGSNHEDYLPVNLLLPAAFAGDFDPTIILPEHIESRDYFDAIRLVGKYYRGHERPSKTIGAIKHLLPKIILLERWESERFEIDEEDAFWLHAMRMTMSAKEWKRIIENN